MAKPKSKSILSNEPCCYICGNAYYPDVHHIYGGGNRPVSDTNGFWVYVCRRCHTYANYSIHKDPDHKWDLELKQRCQQEYEKTHTRDEFIRKIGRSYL